MALSKETIQNLRQEYKIATLSEQSVAKDPISQFSAWFTEALEKGIYEPNAMTLATATADGKPSARIMLLKSFDQNGFVFYTNYLSRKGREMNKNPHASLLFFWPEMERQIRIEGIIEKVSKEESEQYFHSRPVLSQIGALVSQQSQEIQSKALLLDKLNDLEKQYEGKTIPKPSHWGGYIVKPQVVEFWQGGQARLHDRIVFKKADKNKWKIVRVAP